MSDLKKHFIQFGEFAPDARFLSGANLKRAESVLPIFGSHRPAPQMEVFNDKKLPGGVLGFGSDIPSEIYVHLSAESVGTEFAHANDIGEALPYAVPEEEANSWLLVLGGISPDDSSYQFWAHSEIGVFQSQHFNIGTSPGVVLDPIGSTKYRIRYRGQGEEIGSWVYKIEWGSVAGGVFTPDATGVEFAHTDKSDGWEHQVAIIPNTDITTPTQSLYARISAKFDTAATEDIGVLSIDSDGGFIPWGGAATPELGLNDDDDATGAESPAIDVGQSKSFRVKLIGLGNAKLEDAGHEFLVRAKGEVAGMNLSTQIHTRDTPEDELVLVGTQNLGAMTTAMADYVHVMGEAAAATITNYDEVYLTAVIGGAAGAGDQVLNPSADIANDGSYWKSRIGQTTGLWEDIQEANGETEFIISENDDDDSTVSVNVPAGSNPDVVTGHFVQYRLRSTVNQGADRLRVILKQGGTEILRTSGGGLRNFYATQTQQISEVNAGKINWSLPFTLSFNKNIAGAISTITLAWAKLVTPGSGSKAYIAEMGATYPASSQIQTSWMELEYSISGSYLPGDQPRILVGAQRNLYEILSDETAILSKSADAYTYQNKGEKSWDFTSWGNNVIATNYADPIQVLRYKSLLFEDMIDMTDTDYTDAGGVDPRCRFLAVVGSQLILADISEDSFVDGRPYTIWHSAMSIYDQFYPADYATQSTYAQILSTPGGITGLIGGERGTIFKKNSLFRMTYVGYPPVYKYDLISKAQGTPYPRGIIRADQDIYFVGNGGIFRLTSDNQITQLAVGKVEKYLFDSRFEQYSLSQFIDYIDLNNDALVMGAYDPHSGLIMWPYQVKEDTGRTATRVLCYAPKEDRYSIIAGSDLTKVLEGEVSQKVVDYIDPSYEITHPYRPQISAIASVGNVISPETSIIKGFHMTGPGLRASDDTGDQHHYYQRFTSGTSQPMFLVTERLAASMIEEVPEGQNIEIQSVRPIARVDGEEIPEFTIQVYASESPTVIDNYQFRSADNSDRNSDGWFSLGVPITGEFFYVVVRVGPMTLSTIKEFLGVQIEYSYGGSR